MSNQIGEYLNNGYKIEHDDGKYVTMRKKKFSIGWFIFWLIFTGGLGCIVQIVLYLVKKGEVVRLKK